MRRRDGTNLRARGRNPRSLGTSPRELGTNPRATRPCGDPDCCPPESLADFLRKPVVALTDPRVPVVTSLSDFLDEPDDTACPDDCIYCADAE